MEGTTGTVRTRVEIAKKSAIAIARLEARRRGLVRRIGTRTFEAVSD